jgi:hypothetical protein
MAELVTFHSKSVSLCHPDVTFALVKKKFGRASAGFTSINPLVPGKAHGLSRFIDPCSSL